MITGRHSYALNVSSGLVSWVVRAGGEVAVAVMDLSVAGIQRLPLQVLVDPVLDFARERGRRSDELLLVGQEHDFAENRQRGAAPGLLVTQRTVVVEADPDSHRDALRSIGGPHEERVTKVARRSGLPHHRDREIAAVKGMGSALRNSDHSTQSLLV